jgi:hypothetical protein
MIVAGGAKGRRRLAERERGKAGVAWRGPRFE